MQDLFRKLTQNRVVPFAGRRAPNEWQVARDVAAAAFHAIGDSVPFGSWIYDTQGRVIFFSPSYLKLIGRTLEDCLNKLWFDFLPDGDRDQAASSWQDCISKGETWDFEFRVLNSAGEAHVLLSRGVPLRDRRGRIARYAGVQLDVTDRARRREELEQLKSELEDRVKKQTEDLNSANRQLLLDLADRVKAEIALRDSESQLSAVFDNALDAMLVFDDQRRVVAVNSSATELFGLSKNELIGSRWDRLLPANARLGVEDRWQSLLQEGTKRGEIEICQADGSLRTVSFSSRANIVPGRHLSSLRDITEQNRAENSLRELSHRLIRLQDDERRRIARELHDSTGQCLAALRMNLDTVHREAKLLAPAARKALEQSLDLSALCARDVRTISYLLHPPLLDEVGLVPAVRWYVNGFSERSGIQVQLDICDECDSFSKDLNTAFFRIVQESLTNIHRHAESKTALIRLFKQDAAVTLEIIDWGRGIPRDKLGSCHDGVKGLGVGITGMRERVRQLGGELEVASTQFGTTVKATFPLEVQDGTLANACCG